MRRVPLRPWAACRGPLGMLLLLAVVWSQTIAPLAALRMTAAAGPLALSVICGHDGAAIDDAAPAAPGCKTCPLCAAGLAAPVLPAVPPASRPLRWSVVAWPIPPPARQALRLHAAGRPRAPPTSL